MQTIISAVEYILSFQAYTMLPLFIFILALVLGIRLSRAFLASITIAVGFVGIFMVFDFFVLALAPAIEALALRTGLEYPALDVGWPPLAAITWAYPLAAVLIPLILVVNIIMLTAGWTKTVNIDLWNFWHFIFMAALVYQVSGSTTAAIAFALIAEIITLKLADGARKQLTDFGSPAGVTISTLSALTYYPIGLAGNKLIDMIPWIRNLNADPDAIRKKIGILGEPMIIGFIIGILLGISGGYELRNLLELAVKIAAVVAILPKMAGMLGEGLMIVSDGMTAFLAKRLPGLKDAAIGLDVAVIVGKTSVIVSGIILIPIALVLALILPGMRFLPIGDLANMMGMIAMITVACRGNVIRSVLIGIPCLVGILYTAGAIAPMLTELAAEVNFTVPGYSGEITSFLDGGNLLRIFLLGLAGLNIWALAAIPFVSALFWLSWRILKNEAVENATDISSEDHD
ncbi:PTS galactitol transporter subunit IIC [Spirochaeta dissipatitropha]